MNMLELAALIAAILAPMAAMTIGFAILLSNQLKASDGRLGEQLKTSEQRLGEQLKASEQRLGEQLKASEQRLGEQLKASEQRLTEQYREVNRDTKTLIREMGFIQGSLGIAPRRRDSDADEAGEAAA